jgi:hypothetical protein
MAKKLSKIDKPEVSEFKGKKKLYLVPFLLSSKDAPAEYNNLYKLYWQQVEEQLAGLEAKMGKVSFVFHEAITQAGKEGLKDLKRISPASHKIVAAKCKGGASLELIEDRELILETTDWERFLLIGFASQKVAKIVTDAYTEATRKRYEHIARRINESLKDDQSGILFIREGHMVQFPAEIEVFSVAPPALDDIHRWLRDRTQVKPVEKETEAGRERKKKA